MLVIQPTLGFSFSISNILILPSKIEYDAKIAQVVTQAVAISTD